MPKVPANSTSPSKVDSKQPDAAPPDRQELDPEDFYYEGPYLVFTAAYHLKRGSCLLTTMDGDVELAGTFGIWSPRTE